MELIPLQNANPAALFAPGGLDPIIEAIEREARSLVPDISTAKGRKEVASNAAKVAKAKVYLDDIGKSYVAELKDLPRKIDAARKVMRDRLDALKDEVRAPLTEYELAEQKRIDNIKGCIAEIRQEPPDGSTAAEIQDRITNLVAFDMSAVAWDEFANEATAARDAALASLRSRLEARRHYEELLEARRQLEQERAERERQERERRIAEDAAARAREEMAHLQVAAMAKTVLPQPIEQVAAESMAASVELPQDEPFQAIEIPAAVIHDTMDRLDAFDDLSELFGEALADRILTAIENGKVSNVSASWVKP